ncbi:MAG: hypothetical protein M1831_005484 [Alyxoria varia]|nr:MAG: hypothetical protein M1831_005484 [Alyxoria varia]
MGHDPHYFKINTIKLEVLMKTMLFACVKSDLTQRQYLDCTNKAENAVLAVMKATQAFYDEIDIVKQEEALKLVTRATALLYRDAERIEDIKNRSNQEVADASQHSIPAVDLTENSRRKATPARDRQAIKRREDGSFKTSAKWKHELKTFLTSCNEATAALEKNKAQCERDIAVLRIDMEQQVVLKLKLIAQDA